VVYVAGKALSAQTFSIAPNPATTSATLYTEASEAGPVQVSLWNLAGQRIYEQTYVLAKGQNTVALQSINRLAKGIYVVRMVSGNRSECTKLLVE
jgi:hypothetical protein